MNEKKWVNEETKEWKKWVNEVTNEWKKMSEWRFKWLSIQINKWLNDIQMQTLWRIN